MPPSYFPLRWESTRDQWWYASPIDWAAANGHYDLVSELLHLDTNLLIKLTSLRRIRRLETVWDDEEQFDDAAKCRSSVARKLLHECECKESYNSLIRAGYGGWLLYTAASAGDLEFVKDLLERDCLLVFGEGEFGITDVFYAAARSKNCELFRVLLDLAVSKRGSHNNGGEVFEVFRWEMMNRAIHGAARGGNLVILKDILGDCLDFSVYRDADGSTILHSAAGRGQIEVVKDLVPSFDVNTATDNQRNTALHMAAYSGYLPVVEILILASPSSVLLTNNNGDTFLHMAVAGFQTPGFRRLDRQIELIKHLLSGKIANMQDIINARNNDGRTALHMAVIENVHSNLVELLMTVPSIDLNIRDTAGMTPLDLLKQRQKSASSEILIKQLLAAGGVSNYHEFSEKSGCVSHFKLQGIASSPGTTFRIPDSEIYLYMGIDNDPSTEELNLCSGELSQFDSPKSSTGNYAARRLKNLLLWPRGKERKADNTDFEEANSPKLFNTFRNPERSPISLRQRYSTSSSQSFSNIPSPSTKMKFTTSLMHGVIQPMLTSQSSSPFSESSISSPMLMDKLQDVDTPGPSHGNLPRTSHRRSSFSKKLMNQYFCFGAQGLAVENSISSYAQPNQSYENTSSLVA